jgi:hypothetical protein
MKRFLLFIPISILFFLLLGEIASAATIYVDYSTGNDTTGDGTSGTPYKSFHKGYTEASADDTINATGTFDWSNADETGDASVTGYTIDKNLTIVGGGPDQTIFQAGPTAAYSNGKRVFTIDSGVTASIQGVTIKNGYISWTDRGMGGGIRNDGTLTLSDSEVTDSFAGGCGYCGSGYGGGLYNTGTATVTNSSFYDNSSWYYGGGVASTGTLTITNSSIIDNTTTGDQSSSNYGAGIGIPAGTANITNCTITGNVASGSGTSSYRVGGMYIGGASTNVYLKNTIIAGNSTNYSSSTKNNIYVASGTLNNNGYNIIGKSNGYTSTTGDWSDPEDDGTFVLNTIGTEGSLSLDTQAAINDNPQKTKTYALTSSSSIASNNANDTANNGVSIPSTDQRGATRASSTDIGSFEYYGGGLTIAAPSTQALSISFTDVQYQDLTFSWTNGDGARRVVFMKEANTGTASPVDGTLYEADSAFESGDQIGSTGWYAVAEGHETSVTVTGLTQNTDYIVHVVEYNGVSSSDCKYNITSSTDNPKSQTSHDPITRYVNSSTGNDTTGDGTSGTPWKTFNHAYTSSKDADTLDATGTFDWSNADETGDASVTGYTIDKNFNIVGHGPDQTIFQAASTTLSSGKRVFTIAEGVTASIQGVTIKNGYISWSSYSSSSSTGGAGIRNDGTLTLSDSEITDNAARGCYYCGIGYGGGLYNSSTGTATVTNSSFYDNDAWYYGGGVASTGTLTITNSSIIDNTTVGDQSSSNYGAGIGIPGGTTNITNCTITGNVASGSGTSSYRVGGMYIGGASTNVYLKNTIIAGNSTNYSSSTKNNIYVASGTLNNNGYNIIGKSNGYTSTTGDWSDPEDDGTFVLNTVGTEGSLSLDTEAAINDNPQKTLTYAITSSGSIAVNNANDTANNGVSIPSTDQRAAGRNGIADIGAFEYEGTYVVSTPTTQASEVSYSSVEFVTMTVSWTNGDGSKRAVFIKQADTGTASPVDTTTYTANAEFGSGTQIGSTGWYSVYSGTGTTVDVTGLSTGTAYIVQVFEYNGIDSGDEKYLTTTSTNNPNTQTTAEINEPTTQAHTVAFSSVAYTQMDVGWTNGNGTSRVVFVKAANTGTATPVDDTSYTANAAFGSGTQIGSTGWYAVYNGTGTSVTVTGLTAGTDYIAQVFEYESYTTSYDYFTDTASNNPNTQASTSVTTPSTQVTNVSFSSVGYTQTDISWTSGDGDRRAIFLKEAGTGTSLPVDDSSYTANAAFESGTQIGSTGWYCVYDGTGTSTTVTGLTLGTEYIAHAVEYSTSGSVYKYLTSSDTNNPNTQTTSTVSEPTTQASNLSFSSVAANQMDISWTRGNGDETAIFVKQASTGTATPVDDTEYTANAAFGSGTQIGSTGWHLVYSGTGTSVTVTGLTGSTGYIAQAFEVNNSGATYNFLTDTATNNPNTQTSAAEVVIGSAVGSQYYVPWSNYYRYSYSQMIYLDSELGSDGSIDYIKFKYNGNNTYTWNNMVVYMAHTSKESFASGSDWVDISSMTEVYSGSISTTAGDPAWYTITLDEAFEYNGTDNLAIAIDNNHGSYTSSSSKWYYSTGTNRYVYRQSDSTNYDPASPGTGTRTSYLPDITINLTPLDETAPTISSISSDKANGTYAAGEVIDIDVTFSEAVTSTGDVTVTLETGETDRTCTFTVSNATTGTCNYTVQAGDTSLDLDATISGTIADQSSNPMSSFTPSTTLAANKALVIDTTNPSVSSLSPLDNSTGIAVDANLVIVFDEAVDVESGNILLKTGDTIVETIDVTGGLVTGTGTTIITINPTEDLSLETEYYVQIASTAFDDAVGNSYAGISDTTSWSFTTDETLPLISSVSATSTTSSGATILWTTNEQSSSQVEYGLTSALSSSSETDETNTSTRVTSHSVELSSLVSCVTYYYQVKSTRATSTQATGTIGSFTTIGCVANSTVTTSSGGSGAIETAAGGTTELTNEDSTGVTITVPAGYHSIDSYFQINKIDDTTVLASVAAPSGYEPVEDFIYQFRALEGVGTVVETFDADLTITMTYDDTDITDLDETSLQIFYNDGSTWTGLTGCVVDPSANTVMCSTDHFSSYGLFGTTVASPGSTNSEGIILTRHSKNKDESDDNDNEDEDESSEEHTIECVDLLDESWEYSFVSSLLSMEAFPVIEKDEHYYCRPQTFVKRGEFVTWIISMQYPEELEYFDINTIQEFPFSDVDKNYIYTTPIFIADEKGIIDGYDDGSFRPEDPINRAELLKILLTEFRGFKDAGKKLDYLKVKYSERNPKEVFQDITREDDWFFPYLYYAVTKNILEGRVYEDDFGKVVKADMLNPVLYSEAAKILFMLIDE